MTTLEPLPKPFEAEFYRERYPALYDLTNDELETHYAETGERQGLHANRLLNRNSFIALIPKEAQSLEIGPFCNPLLRSPNTRYFDVLPRAGLEKRAKQIGYPSDIIPDIHYVSPVGDLGVVDQEFDCVLSSHCIEHQPDLVHHLNQVSRLLKSGGRYYLLIPDKRFCFDWFNRESTIAEVIDAHHARRRVHQLRSVIEHRAMTTHNDAVRHWAGDHGTITGADTRILRAVAEYEQSNGNYIDVHAWYFTPSAAREIFSKLHDIRYIDLGIAAVYATRRNANEFWMVLEKA